jgi:hypothetical protein
MCNILQTRNQISQKLGELQVDNLEAEMIISGFGGDIFSVIKRGFNVIEFNVVSHLLETINHIMCVVCSIHYATVKSHLQVVV